MTPKRKRKKPAPVEQPPEQQPIGEVSLTQKLITSEELVDTLLLMGRITKRGSYLYLDGETLGNGKAAVIARANDNENVFGKLFEAHSEEVAKLESGTKPAPEAVKEASPPPKERSGIDVRDIDPKSGVQAEMDQSRLLPAAAGRSWREQIKKGPVLAGQAVKITANPLFTTIVEHDPGPPQDLRDVIASLEPPLIFKLLGVRRIQRSYTKLESVKNEHGVSQLTRVAFNDLEDVPMMKLNEEEVKLLHKHFKPQPWQPHFEPEYRRRGLYMTVAGFGKARRRFVAHKSLLDSMGGAFGG